MKPDGINRVVACVGATRRELTARQIADFDCPDTFAASLRFNIGRSSFQVICRPTCQSGLTDSFRPVETWQALSVTRCARRAIIAIAAVPALTRDCLATVGGPAGTAKNNVVRGDADQIWLQPLAVIWAKPLCVLFRHRRSFRARAGTYRSRGAVSTMHAGTEPWIRAHLS